jgi:hypothetical protein
MSAAASTRRALAAGAVVLGLAGCGSVPPATPPPQSSALDSATSGIADVCGRSYRVTEFPGDHHRYLAPLEVTAGQDVRRLASVYAQNHDYLYFGETLDVLVEDSISYLRACGMPNAASLLVRLTGLQ